MRTVVFTVPGKPVPKGRPRFKNGRVYTPKKTREYEEFVAYSARSKADNRFEGPVRVSLRFHTKSKADLDNLIKSVLDGCQIGGVFENDSQVRAINAYYGEPDEERVEVMVEDIDG